jgi:hypothetical protein
MMHNESDESRPESTEPEPAYASAPGNGNGNGHGSHRNPRVPIFSQDDLTIPAYIRRLEDNQ